MRSSKTDVNPFMILLGVGVGAMLIMAFGDAEAKKPAAGPERVLKRGQYITRPKGMSDAAWEAVREGQGHGAAKMGGLNRSTYFNEGADAFKHGASSGTNPYARSGWQGKTWDRGWHTAYQAAHKAGWKSTDGPFNLWRP
jgi:hypothetical protein